MGCKRVAEKHRTRHRNPKRSCRGLTLMASSFYLPKESEDIPLGQDAHFICDHEQTIGIADGVGGCGGIDSGVYARQLMDNAKEFVQGRRKKTVNHPMTVLETAFERSEALGRSTACIITLNKSSLHAVNLGDSGFRVIRGEKTVYRSPVQQARFNCPYQLGATSRFSPSDADEIVVGVEHGDVLVAGTDGLFDNLFDEEIEKIVHETSLQDAKSVAANLGQAARVKSLDKDCDTPYARAGAEEAAKEENMCFFLAKGGKYDDVTVIVGYIS